MKTSLNLASASECASKIENWQFPLMQKAQEKPIDFSEFMQMALYHPLYGYYTDFCQKIGQDFVTAPIISKLFGRTLAKVLQPIVQKNTNSNQVQTTYVYKILEIGAGNGTLALQILTQLMQTYSNEKYSIENINLEIEYSILEISARLQNLQKETLNAWHEQYKNIIEEKNIKINFKFYQHIDEIPQIYHQSPKSEDPHMITTLIANEWLDAIPINLWRFSIAKQQWFARKVGFDDQQGWHWVDEAIHHHIDEMQSLPPEIQNLNTPENIAELLNHDCDYITESHEISVGMLDQLFDRIQPRQLLWIDYGHLAEQYYHPQRCQGTLLCYFEQQVHDQVFKNIGQQDITAHVNFSLMIDTIMAKNYQVEEFTSQARFLMNYGILDDLAQLQKPLKEAGEFIQLTQLNQGVLTLLSEAEMGEGIKVLHMLKNDH